jgi:DNA transformation protein
MTPEYRTWLTELFAPLGDLSVRRVFNFHGLYRGGTMFGIVADQRVYLKADESSRKLFVAAGMGAFEYVARNGERIVTSYWGIPETLYDEPDEIVAWARRAYEVALKSPTAKKKKRKKTR